MEVTVVTPPAAGLVAREGPRYDSAAADWLYLPERSRTYYCAFSLHTPSSNLPKIGISIAWPPPHEAPAML